MGLKDVGSSRCCAQLAGIWAKRADIVVRVELTGNPTALGGSPAGAVPRFQAVLVALRVRLSALFCTTELHTGAGWSTVDNRSSVIVSYDAARLFLTFGKDPPLG